MKEIDIMIPIIKVPTCAYEKCVHWVESYFEHTTRFIECNNCSRFYSDKFEQKQV